MTTTYNGPTADSLPPRAQGGAFWPFNDMLRIAKILWWMAGVGGLLLACGLLVVSPVYGLLAPGLCLLVGAVACTAVGLIRLQEQSIEVQRQQLATLKTVFKRAL
jgi:hypothetical protein